MNREINEDCIRDTVKTRHSQTVLIGKAYSSQVYDSATLNLKHSRDIMANFQMVIFVQNAENLTKNAQNDGLSRLV